MHKVLAVFLILSLSLYWYTTVGMFCQAPLSYQVAPIDARFNIADDEARDLLVQAEAVWETAAGRELFYPVQSGADVLVSFVFDDRQERAIAEASLRDSLDTKESNSGTILKTYEALVAEYQDLQKTHESAVRIYENRLYDHNATVARYNDAGGAPEAVFAELAAAEASLDTEAEALETMNKKLVQLSNQINEISERGNRLIEQYNNSVQEYNAQFGEPDEFTQGDYKDGEIHIYTFTSRDELLQVLVHEFGHALDLPHVEGSDSIMYYLLEDQSVPVTLSRADTDALLTTCGAADDLSTKIRTVINRFI